MPGPYNYVLSRFVWDSVNKCHTPPSDSVCVVDWRPSSEQEKAGPSDGVGVFACPGEYPSEADFLGSGYAPELILSPSARTRVKTVMNLPTEPAGNTLAEVMADVMGPLSDPTGLTGPKPILPTNEGVRELHLEGHSRVWSQAVDSADVMGTSKKGIGAVLRKSIQLDLDTAEKTGGVTLLQQALGAWLLKLGVTRKEIEGGAPARKTQYERLLSDTVKQKHGTNAKPKDPKTQRSETWPNNTANLIATPQLNTWATPTNTAWGGAMTVNAGYVYGTLADASAKWRMARCEAAVSSTDHIVSASGYSTDNVGRNGLCVRMAEGDTGTCYEMSIRWNLFYEVAKWINGVRTLLAQVNAESTPNPQVFSLRANGSTITAKYTGFPTLTVTDTAVTGYLKAGVAKTEHFGAGNSRLGAWLLDDELSGGGGRTARLNLLGIF